jgi:putative PIN family toxin of toxin-antitoxin system
MFKKKTITNIKEFKDIVQRIAEVIFDLQFKMINSIPKKEYLYHTRDKTDDRILDAAICGNIDAILTGDKDLINFRCPKVQILNIHHQLI